MYLTARSINDVRTRADNSISHAPARVKFAADRYASSRAIDARMAAASSPCTRAKGPRIPPTTECGHHVSNPSTSHPLNPRREHVRRKWVALEHICFMSDAIGNWNLCRMSTDIHRMEEAAAATQPIVYVIDPDDILRVR
eukprot:m.992433 g.992433  ORF g.992433 m.992433 type:complete len:140 (+) comp24006_c0_seq11:1636-2055(+)